MNEEVRQWLADTADPRTEIVAELCEITELVDARARGEIKWSAPSYRITDHFATTGFDPRGSSVRLVLHRGVQPHPDMPRPDIDDPDGLLD
ncbi:hypothetical protein DFO66_105216 [Brevibacterium sanguinis]|uniref:YdhG-like domain-containing protein n=2 Tax=Brevibacterium TaxID=1696 RepID=A0A366IHP6_9MICO|nr:MULTISPECIES: hypothetical protein [Brevibacterium]RBP65110.1 hypothetical protein DFO66_105216 [Brevibacterium sanguinis]RBP71373.1 hypothetical protein DFO65_106216 [Brevibacterium celere]